MWALSQKAMFRTLLTEIKQFKLVWFILRWAKIQDSINGRQQKKSHNRITRKLKRMVKEPGSEYIGHVSVNFGRAQIIGNHICSFLSCVDNDIDVVAIKCDGTSVNTGVKGGVINNMELILNRPLQWFVRQLRVNVYVTFSRTWMEPQLGPE
ncbi:hypothetical protein AVEN_16928-1, partial [Araneus ventricosus]